MRWIVSAGADIVVNTAQLEARRTFIAEVTTAAVSPWSPLQVPHAPTLRFLYCNSADGVDGTFITAHIYEVYELCALPQIAGGTFVVANTCIWERMAHKKILAQLLLQNRNIRLWFAKQELSIDACGIFKQSTTLINLGEFDFQTSFSERELYRYRKNGLLATIEKAFQPVSPIILPGELGGNP